ncbi:MAG: uncharacterized protein QOJ38_320 [Solirubrobacterales bacterium]|nr:uncharacterized protein [Solirubrobacterales bacterium]
MAAGKRLSSQEHKTKLTEFEELWRAIEVLAVDESLLSIAAELAGRHSLRAYDAVHLAAAITFAPDRALTFACWDRDLSNAAVDEGFQLLPR